MTTRRVMAAIVAAGLGLAFTAPHAEARGAGGFGGGVGGRPSVGGGFAGHRGHWGQGGFGRHGFGRHGFGYRHGWRGGFGHHGRFGHDRRFGYGRFGPFYGGGLPYAYGAYGYGGYGGYPGFYRGGNGPVSSQPTVGIPPSPVLPPAIYVIGKPKRAAVGARPVVRSGRGVLTTD